LLLPSRSCNLYQGKDKTQALSRPSRLSRHHLHPNTQDLNENVAAGHVINNPSIKLSFPDDASKASQLARINAAIVTLQNLNGEGKGCPVASTTFLAQEAAINGAGTQRALLARQTAPSPSLTPAQVDALAPQLGFTAGQNPSGKSANIASLLT
jgi:hypothetical protein